MSTEDRATKRVLLFILLYCCMILPIMFFYGSSLIARTQNPVGSTLWLAGVCIAMLGGALTVIGNHGIDETSSLWEDEKVYASQRMIQSVSYPFRLERPCLIGGSISGRVDPFEFVLEEFFGETYGISVDWIKPKVHLKGEGPKEIDIKPVSLPPGSYTLRFEKYPQKIEAFFTLTKTYRKKPYESFYHLGLTLLEVGIPILITGAVSLGFGSSIQA